MTHFGFLILAYAAFVCQTCLTGTMAVGGTTPDFLMLLAIAALLAFDGWPALFWAGCAGLLRDCLAAEPLGIDMFLIALIGYGIRLRLGRGKAITTFQFGLICFVSLCVLLAASSAIREMLTGGNVYPANLLWQSAGRSLYSSLLGIGLLIGWRGMQNLLPSRRSREFSGGMNRWNLLSR